MGKVQRKADYFMAQDKPEEAMNAIKPLYSKKMQKSTTIWELLYEYGLV